MRFILIPVLSLLLSCSYSEKDFLFNNDELKLINAYKPGDTLYFENLKHDVDTILVLRIDSSKKEKPGYLMALPAHNSLSVVITHLPVDKWTGTHINGLKKDTVFQELISITKRPQTKTRTFMVQFQDFFSSTKGDLGEFHTETLTINGKQIANYYQIQRQFPKAMDKIEEVYWTNDKGLVAYKYKNGKYWLLKD